MSSAAWRTCQSRSSRQRRKASSALGSSKAARATTARRLYRRLVLEGGEDDLDRRSVSDRTERGDGCLATQRVTVAAPPSANGTRPRRARVLVLALGASSPRAHAAASATRGSASERRPTSATTMFCQVGASHGRRRPGELARTTPHTAVGIAESVHDHLGIEVAGDTERA